MSTTHTLSDEDAQTYLDIGIKAREVVRLRWPDATDEQADYVLWEQTTFPLYSGLHDLADAVAEVEEMGEYK